VLVRPEWRLRELRERLNEDRDLAGDAMRGDLEPPENSSGGIVLHVRQTAAETMTASPAR
jgi:hypothetical protein